jgi:putative flippase GtrA
MNFIIKLFNVIPKKFLLVGLLNTVFSYFTGILNYFLFLNYIGIIGIGILNNIVNITFAFFMFKKYVFKTKNTNWFFEYLRSYVVYGVKGVVGIFVLWLCISIFKFNIYISQAVAMLVTVFLSYTGHKNFTFKVKKVD